jgi:hypothetical protein
MGFAGATPRRGMVHTRRSTIGLSVEAAWGCSTRFAALAHKGGKPERVMIDATHLKAHRAAVSLLKKGLFPDILDAPKAA